MRAGEYAGPSWWPLKLLRETGHEGVRRLGLVWLGAGAVAIVLAVLEARLNWSGIPIQLGDATVGLTVYPPLFFSLLLAIWLGPMWGIVPGYAAGLISGLIGGLLASGVPEVMARLSVEFDENTREGKLATVTNAVEKLTGRKPRALKDWLAAEAT